MLVSGIKVLSTGTQSVPNMRKLLFFLLLSPLFLTGMDGTSPVSDILKQRIEEGVFDGRIAAGGIILQSQIILPEFYRENDFKPAWKDTKNRKDLLFCLEDAANDGLDPDDYHLLRIRKLLNEVKQSKDPDPEKLADLDLLMTDGILLYVTHLITGKVDQSEILPGWDLPKNKIPVNAVERIKAVLDHRNLRKAVAQLRPDLDFYEYLRINLQRYRKIAEEGGWPVIPLGEVLKKGMKDPRIALVRKRLSITGDLRKSPGDSTGSELFDEALEKAVMRFQQRHNLNQDGVVGNNTLSFMNIPVEKKIDQIRVNLERTRWVGYEIPPDFIVVNIAGFNLRRVTNNKEVFFSRVIVGKKFHETPVFRGKIRYIVLNPTWTVPHSIAVKETLPKLKRDPSYLSRHHMVLMNARGKILDPATIDFSKYSESNFPFTVRQEAGPRNALGQVKFIFPNKYNVYLHDTPGRGLFATEKRTFSHGCIRLEKKWELMLNLLDDPSWDMERINKILASEKTTRVNLKKPIDIYLLYWTAGAKEDMILFSRDVYDRDPKVLAALNQPYMYKKAMQ